MKFILVTSLISMVYVFAMDVYTKVSSRLVYNPSNLSLISVEVSGAVNVPGVYYLASGSTYEEAINMAGGLSSQASLISLNMNSVINESTSIYVPMYTEIEKININTATLNELTKLDGVGEVIAKRIVNYRKSNGLFKSVSEIKNVVGIGDSLYAKIENYICVDD